MLSMYCRATEAWGRFWRRNKESSSSQRLCQQQEAASLQRPTGLGKLPCLTCTKLGAKFQLSFLFFPLLHRSQPSRLRNADPSISARTFTSLLVSHCRILQQPLSRSSYDPDNSSFRQRPSAASRDCGSSHRRDVHRPTLYPPAAISLPDSDERIPDIPLLQRL